MPPLAPPHGEKSSSSGGRQQRQGMAATGSPAQQQRSASFHGRGTEQQRQQRQRPKTLPDLLAGVRGGAKSFRSGSGSRSPPRTPSKVLVSVAVQQSMWPLHVLASAEWTVADLVAAAAAVHRPGRLRPPLLAVQLGESEPKGEDYGTGLQELLPVPKIFSWRSSGCFIILRRSKRGHEGGVRGNTGLAELHAVLADDVIG